MNDNQRFMNWYLPFTSLLIGLVLVRSAILHLENSYAFLASIYAYDIVGPRLGVALAAIIPQVQLNLGLILIFFPRLRYFGLNVAQVVFTLFSVIQVVTLMRGLNIDCGCFGSSVGNPIGWKSIGLAVTLSLTSTFLILRVRSISRRLDT